MKKENRRLLAEIDRLKDVLEDENRRFSIAQIEAQEAHELKESVLTPTFCGNPWEKHTEFIKIS